MPAYDVNPLDDVATEGDDGVDSSTNGLPDCFLRFPTVLLGKLLDFERRKSATGDVVTTYGHASANAIHALAIKLAAPPGHVLNKQHLRKHYGIGWRRFAEGIRVAKERGVLERGQAGRRTFATERILGATDTAPFVALDKALLGERSRLVAFVAAVNLSPDPERPDDVAGRFGITAPATIRALVQDARDGGHIAHHQDTSGKILVARRGYTFGDTASDMGVKNGVTKNGPHSKQRDSSKLKEGQKESYGTSVPFGAGTAKDDFGKPMIREPDPERIILSTWRSAPYFRQQGFAFDGVAEPVMTLEEWRGIVAYYGGAPAQVATPAAHRQALEIAHELSALSRVALIDEIRPWVAMVGLAAAICAAHARGKPIRSLGFIADSLARRVVHQEDDSWAYDLPCRIPQAEFDGVAALASDWIGRLETWGHGISFDRRELTSTYRVEELYRLIRDYGRNNLVGGINHAHDNKLGDGRTIMGWTWFADYIEPAKTAKAAAAAAAAPQPTPAPPPVRQGAEWESDVEEACAWLRDRLGRHWHSSQRISAAARRAGIDREVYAAARERLQCQKWRAPPIGYGSMNGQWCMALPDVPAAQAA
jgi:hypothetical protein